MTNLDFKTMPRKKKEDAQSKDTTVKKAKSEESSEEKKPSKKSTAKKSAVKAKTGDFIYPTINIGLVGHVDHGKTTLTEKLSGKWTDTHSEELKRGITIRLGYADAIFYKNPNVSGNNAFTTQKETDGKQNELLRKVSFVDAPGHESLMATMLAGASIMDGALLLVAANEECPQPQTREHLMALQIMGIKNIIVVQNKIDLVSKEDALNNYKQIKEFLKGTDFENAPVIPISAQQGINIGALIAAIQEFIPDHAVDESVDPLMYVARSFDINKPGSDPQKLVGGILGGMVAQGKFHLDDEVEIKPGRRVNEHGRTLWKPILAKISGLMSGGENVDMIRPGGSVGMMTSLDPSIVKSDSLGGSTVGFVGKTPETLYEITLDINLLERVVGSRDELVVEPLREKEALVLNVNSSTTVGMVSELSKNKAKLQLRIPICAKEGSKITISRRLNDRWRLIGYGILR